MPNTMKAYHFEAFNDALASLRLREDPMPSPGMGQVVVRMRATSLNYRDLLAASGQLPGIKPGLIPLSDGAGEVVAVGEAVYRVRPGDRVVAAFNPTWISGRPEVEFMRAMLGGTVDGVLAEYVMLDQQGLERLPDGLSFQEGATLPCAAVTAWSALHCGLPLLAGQTVLVQGTGGVSIFALQLAKSFGCRVIATTSSAEKAGRLRQLGADEVVNYAQVPEWGAAVRELTGGRGVDRVVEVGGPGTLEQSIGCTAFNAQIALVGFVGGLGAQINPRLLMRGGLSTHSIAVGSRTDLAKLLAAAEATQLRPVIDRVFAFSQAPDAYRHLQSRRHFGKVVINVD
ncbi:NAD(P)-dependent alcohol dehydrogenase [Hydrocarboniphaga sp.]|uniref:zinc-dependent alcohol dehydrogenase family protein n=1 Tax=Hydrocarboniphaga sp. TaxID=2033016 RepID=UPI002604353B|nr:NAD(P)-dependent alcohol dehydrogenase [Hydrocarboniphaga sp.]